MAEENGGDTRSKVTYHYIKSNAFRVIHADGVQGGLTPNLKVQMALFNERMPIPRQIVHNVKSGPGEGSFELGDEVERSVRDGIVREVEAEVLMDPIVAERVANWLLEKVKDAKATLDAHRAASSEDA